MTVETVERMTMTSQAGSPIREDRWSMRARLMITTTLRRLFCCIAALVLATPHPASADDLAFAEEQLVIPEDPVGGEMLDDTAGSPNLLADESVVGPATEILDGTEPASIVDVSSRGIDGMQIDDFALDEFPYEASSGRWFWNGGWFFGGESLWMDRSRNNRQNIVVDYDKNLPNRQVITYKTTAQPFNVSPGARVTLGKSLGRDYLDRDRTLEVIYYGGMNWNDSDGWNAIKGGALYTPLAFGAPGFNGATRYTTTFNSDFNSMEWNYKLRRRLGRDQLVMSPGGGWTKHAERGFLPALILGTRVAAISEQFTLDASRAGVAPADFSGNYRITANNWLLGLNIGGELISQNEFFYWGLRGRAAPALAFDSTAQTSTGVNTNPAVGPVGTTNGSSAASRTGPGFIGDLTLMAGWNITPNFSFQAGYDFLWVAGIASTNRQFNLDGRDVNAIDPGGQVFYNGVSFGFNGSW